MDKRIKKYTKKDGTTAYKFNIYLGIDEQTGKSKRTTRRGFKNVKSATETLKKIDYQVSQGILDSQPNNSNITFVEVYDEWFSGYANTVRESTRYKQRKVFENHILPIFGKYRIRTIKSIQIQKAVNKWFEETEYAFKPWFNSVNLIFKYAITQDYILTNPCSKIIRPKKIKKEKTLNFWTKGQLHLFLNSFDKKKNLEKYTLFRLLAFTGIRRGECLALKWDDVNFENCTLRIDETLSHGEKGRLLIQPPKTRGSNRIITLDKISLSYLNYWRQEQRKIYLKLGINTSGEQQLIFPSRKNTFKSLNTPAKWLSKQLKLINSNMEQELPKISIHGFRHSHSSALFAAGADLKEVQERLGHDDAQTTLNIYTHVTEQQNVEAVNKLIQFLDF